MTGFLKPHFACRGRDLRKYRLKWGDRCKICLKVPPKKQILGKNGGDGPKICPKVPPDPPQNGTLAKNWARRGGGARKTKPPPPPPHPPPPTKRALAKKKGQTGGGGSRKTTPPPPPKKNFLKPAKPRYLAGQTHFFGPKLCNEKDVILVRPMKPRAKAKTVQEFLGGGGSQPPIFSGSTPNLACSHFGPTF